LSWEAAEALWGCGAVYGFVGQSYGDFEQMSTGRHSFKHNDAARLIRATAAAGLKVKGVTLNGRAITVLVDDATATDCGKNPWDQVLEDDTDKKRPA
jgi:hypothetical protein